jgi:hypothetical protein
MMVSGIRANNMVQARFMPRMDSIIRENSITVWLVAYKAFLYTQMDRFTVVASVTTLLMVVANLFTSIVELRILEIGEMTDLMALE